MINIPEVKVGIVAVSRDCFPESLSVNRRKALIKAYTDKYDAKDIYECPVCIVESEIHMEQALADIKAAGCNALCVYLGNFGPEISETMLAKYFDGPNDGLVSESSFPWGEDYHFLTVDGKRGISHGDMIDLNRENIQGFDVREFYVELVHGLKEKGL